MNVLRILGVALLLSSCGGANAVAYDSGSDVHCHALSNYFGWSELKKVEEGQPPGAGALGMFVMADWYSEKFTLARAEIGGQADAEYERAGQAIGDHFEASKEAYKACVDRAGLDPAYEAFARRKLLEFKQELERR